MEIGPVTYLVIEFIGNQFKGEIIPALQELVDNGVIHIMDLVFVRKDEDGSVEAIELSALPEELAAAFGGVQADAVGLFTEDDITALAGTLANNSSAGILLFEHLWAKPFVAAVANANGRWVLMESVPGDVLAEALADAAV